jgi:hypothetical protein
MTMFSLLIETVVAIEESHRHYQSTQGFLPEQPEWQETLRNKMGRALLESAKP